jgi:hypothetical protein
MKNPKGRPKKNDKVIKISLCISQEVKKAIEWLKNGQKFQFSKEFNCSKEFSKMILDKRNSKIKV